MRIPLIKTVAFFLLLFISHFSTYSQTEDFKFLTVEDGLAQSQVHCILQDKRGYLWLGTDAGGGSIYDGKTFTNFSTADGLASNRILSFAEDNKGNIWIGTSKGVSIYNGKEFIDKPSKLEALDVRSIGTILCEKDGTIWLGTSKCLYSWNGNTLTKFDSVDGYIYTILRDSRGNLWAATDLNGLFKINGKEIKQYTRADGLSTEAITTIDEPIPGELWIGSNKGISLLHIDDDKIEHFSELKNISHLFHDTKNVWVLGEGIGICTFSGPGFKQFSNQKKIPTDAWCGIKDREENLWFGTNGAGVLKYQSTPFSRLSMENGLSGRLVFSILHDSKGNEWYGSEGGITQFGTDKATGTKKIIKFNSENPGYPDARCWAMLEDKKGNIWFSSISRGLYKYQGGAFTNYLNSNENEKYIRSLLEDDEGNIWVGSRAGLIKINDGKKIKVYGPADGLPDQAILSSLKDSKGGLWFVSNAGLFKFDPKGIKSKFISYTKADGLINDGLLAIAEDSDGNIWCAGFAGISKVDLKTRTCKNITASDGLTSNTIYLLVADHSGNLYIGSNQGIDKFNTAVYNKTGTIEIKHYGKLEGFTGVECNTNSYFRGKDGSIWFGTINGAIRLDPTRQKNNNAEPFTYITDINLFFDPLERTEFVKETDSLTGLPTNLKLPYDKNHLTFNCIALSLTIPEKTLYSYKMAGFDKAWSPLSKQSYATYSFLPPGNYTFMVRAMNSDGVWTEAPATFNFTIVPPYWQTWWFYILASIALVLVFILFLRVRFNSLKNRAKDLQRKITHKTAELKKEKEIVDSQTKIIERKNKNITASINYAQRIQNTVLPTKENILKLFPDAFILLRPKDIVSGDFSWFSQVGDKIIVAAADCTGHGIPGAFMSLIGNNLLNDVVNNEKITEPAQILHRLHEKLIVTLKKTEKDSATVDGMDISLFVIDKKNQTLNFTSTGQPLIFIRDGKMEAINGGKYPLGLILKKERLYEPRTISIQKDDVFYLFTDGYVDQFGEMDDDKFSEVRLRNLLLEIHHQTMKDQENNLNRMLDLWKGQIPQLDDVMVIGIRI